MIGRIRLVSLYVSDQDRALDFYVNKLGCKVQQDNVFGDLRWLEVVLPDGNTALGLLRPNPGMEGAKIGGFTNMVLATDDIEGTYRDLVQKGVEFVEEPAMQPWGMMQAIFNDPDGNTFVLVQTSN